MVAKIKFQGSGLNASSEIPSFSCLLCEYILCMGGGEGVYFRRDMHLILKVLSNWVLALMADGQSFLHGKKLVYSHMHFSAGNWNFRPSNICIESTI